MEDCGWIPSIINSPFSIMNSCCYLYIVCALVPGAYSLGSTQMLITADLPRDEATPERVMLAATRSQAEAS